MIGRTRFSILLLTGIALTVLDNGPLETGSNSGIISTAFAVQKGTLEEALKNTSQKITGQVSDVITTADFTYAEIDTGEEKVWAAAPGVVRLEKGDIVALSTEMPMHNFYSKTLKRNFSLIYFIKHYITDKKTSTIAAPHGQNDKQQILIPNTTTFTGAPIEVRKGEFLREATLNGLNTGNKKFSDFKGKPLIINVWASWCGPCRAEMGSLERLAGRFNGKEFNIIGISTDDYRDKATTFITQTGITFENFLDHKLMLEKMLGASTLPLTVLVDANGRVLEKVHGAREWDKPEIIMAIGDVLQISLKDPVK